MNRKTIGWMLATLVILACVTTWVRADTLTLGSTTAIPAPYAGAAYDITAAGTLDWLLPGKDRKAGGTAIQVTGDDYWVLGCAAIAGGDNDYPAFSYTDGTASASATVWSEYNYPTPYTTIAVPAGSGQITVWWGDGGTAPYTPSKINAWFDGEYPGSLIVHDLPNNSREMCVFNYSAASARTIWVSSDMGGAGCANAGWFGIATSAIPEPSALLLVVYGITGLLAYACRNRR